MIERTEDLRSRLNRKVQPGHTRTRDESPPGPHHLKSAFSGEIKPIQLPARSPNLNAFAER
jgi:hypothetical protein